MENSFQIAPDRKVIKTFCVVGLDEKKITKYREEDNANRFVQNIDIVQKDMKLNMDELRPNETEKWSILNKSSNFWLRVQYSKVYSEPITGIKVIECEYESPEFLVLIKVLIYRLLAKKK
jgi:hypothetical protein